MMKNKRIIFFIIIVMGIIIFPYQVIALEPAKTGFYEEADGNKYYYINSIKQYGITNIDGEDYFLGEFSGRVISGWVTSSINGNTYYADTDGKITKGIATIGEDSYFLGELTGRVVYGWVTSSINGNTYYTNKSGIIQKDEFILGGKKYYTEPDGNMKNGFYDEIDGYRYYYIEGERKFGITRINGEEYFLGEFSGRVISGWVTSSVNGNTYYTDIDGKITKGITIIEEDSYFLGGVSGRVVYGWVTSSINGKIYYTNELGIIQKNEFILGDKNYYTEPDGNMKNGFYDETDGYRYYYIGGERKFGITKINGEEYFLGEHSGRVISGWVISSVNGNTYYTDNDGKIMKGITIIGEDSYFLGELSGRLVYGWVISSINGKTYYTNELGVIQKNEFIIDSKKYYTELDGSLKNGFYDETDGNRYYYTVGERKYGITKINGIEYFLGELTGRVVYGWVTSSVNGNTYYTDIAGKIMKGITVIGEDSYFLGEISGRLVYGWVTSSINGNIYYTDINGRIQTGVHSIDGIEYRFSANGALETGWQTINGNRYYFYRDGTYATGVVKITGARYKFSNKGVLQYSNFKHVIDVSYHQGNIDWNTLWNSGAIDGVILRIGYAGTLDNKFPEYLREVKRLNIPYSVYQFSYAYNRSEAIFEANKMIEWFRQYDLRPSFDVYYDLESWEIPSLNEYSSNISVDEYGHIVRNYISTLHNAGLGAKVYTYLNYSQTKLSTSTEYIDWIAHYNDNNGYTKPHRGWQYTSSARVPGISTNVDLNVFHY